MLIMTGTIHCCIEINIMILLLWHDDSQISKSNFFSYQRWYSPFVQFFYFFNSFKSTSLSFSFFVCYLVYHFLDRVTQEEQEKEEVTELKTCFEKCDSELCLLLTEMVKIQDNWLLYVSKRLTCDSLYES